VWKNGSGKTTFARALERERKALLLSADEFGAAAKNRVQRDGSGKPN
jgi:predicted kinase